MITVTLVGGGKTDSCYTKINKQKTKKKLSLK